MNSSNGPGVHKETGASAGKSAKKAVERERVRILIDSAKQVGPALFFSLLIIVVSVLPVLLLEAQEGRMFRPLAWTKTLAVGFSSLLAITLVPILMVIFIRGKLRPESEIRFQGLRRHSICQFYDSA
jgi:Cu/Ag efflux pump CusA